MGAAAQEKALPYLVMHSIMVYSNQY